MIFSVNKTIKNKETMILIFDFLVFSGQLRKSPDLSGLLLFVFALFSPKSLCFWIWVVGIYGGSEGDRTLYLLHAMEALSQVSYRPSVIMILIKTYK